MIVDCALYAEGRRQPGGDSVRDSLDLARQHRDSFVWLGLHEPTADELAQVAAQFSLHALAVEDAVKAHQRAKLEEFPDSSFVVLKTVRYDEPTQQVELGDVMLFLGDGFVVTVRHGPARALSGIRKRLEREPELLECGPYSVLYAVADAVVDDYSEILAAVEDDIEEVEERVFSPVRGNDAPRIYNLKREIIEFRRAVRPLVEPMERLASQVESPVRERLRPYFRDVADHALRVVEQVESYDDLLGSVLAANLAQVGVQQNNDMRRISAWVAIVAVPTMIAGIYGMNFDYMPELHWHWGYPAALVVMGTACTVLYRMFKRSGWL